MLLNYDLRIQNQDDQLINGLVNLIINVNLTYMDVLMLIRLLCVFRGRILRIFLIDRLLMGERNRIIWRNLYRFFCFLAEILLVFCFILECVLCCLSLEYLSIHRLIIFGSLCLFQVRMVFFVTFQRIYTLHSTYQQKLYTD